jgi:predicted ribosome quality control (RQC) complex YloA/Tae2 family protein
MPFDALYCAHLAPELKKYSGSRVDKIFRPEAVELDMLIYTPQREKKFLIISASMSSPRVSVFSGEREHPSDPDAFIMLIRKHLVGARITDVFAVAKTQVRNYLYMSLLKVQWQFFSCLKKGICHTISGSSVR